MSATGSAPRRWSREDSARSADSATTPPAPSLCGSSGLRSAAENHARRGPLQSCARLPACATARLPESPSRLRWRWQAHKQSAYRCRAAPMRSILRSRRDRGRKAVRPSCAPTTPCRAAQPRVMRAVPGRCRHTNSCTRARPEDRRPASARARRECHRGRAPHRPEFSPQHREAAQVAPAWPGTCAPARRE